MSTIDNRLPTEGTQKDIVTAIENLGTSLRPDFADLGDVSIDTTTLSDGQVPKWNNTTQKWENANESGGSGGHTIKDDDGTSLTQRANLQFKGVYSHDDSTNGASVVEVARSMTWAEYQQLSADEKKGLITITDVFTNDSGGYSETTLWSGTELCNDVNFHELTLSDNYTNYDMFYILVKDPDDQIVMPLFMTNAVELSQQYVSAVYEMLGAFFEFDVANKIKVARISGTKNLTYLKVVGIKIGLSVGGGLSDYSTTEHKTGRKWVDGKDIWECTTTTHSILPYDESWVDSGIEITGDIISVYGSITRDNEPINFGGSFNSIIYSKWIVRNNKLLIGVKGEYGETYKINNITAEYTKSS